MQTATTSPPPASIPDAIQRMHSDGLAALWSAAHEHANANLGEYSVETGHLSQAKLDTWGVTVRGRGCVFTPDGADLSNWPVFFAANLLSN